MATKKQKKKGAASKKGSSTAGKSGMPTGDMNQAFKSGLMEMPSGGDTTPAGPGQGGMDAAPAMEGSRMPGESQEKSAGGPVEGEMPGGGAMTST